MKYGQIFLSDYTGRKDVSIDAPTETQQPVASNSGKNQPNHIATVRQMHGNYYLTYDDKDFGTVMYGGDVAMSGNNIAYIRNLGTDINPDSHVFLNREDQGSGMAPLFDGDHFAFIRIGKDIYDNHVMYDGKDLGVVSPGQDIGTGLSLAGGHSVFSRDVSGKSRAVDDSSSTPSEGLSFTDGEWHIIYDGVDKGEGWNPVIGENSLAFLRKVNSEDHVIYNGKDMGRGDPVFCVTDDSIIFTRSMDVNSSRTRNEIIRNDQKIGISNDNGGELFCSGKDYSFTDDHSNLIFNGKNLGVADGYGHAVVMEDGHIAFTRQVDGKTHVIYDGKDLGEGIYPDVSGSDVAFVREVNGKKHVFLNGRDMGETKEGKYPVLLGGKLTFYRPVGEETHVIYDGTDIGFCGKECDGYSGVMVVSGEKSKALRLGN